MKNKKMEQYKISAKHYAKHWQKQLNQDGNHLPHAYPENERKKLAWWDDVFFKLGSQVVAVWWRHPRQHYCDLCEEQTELLFPYPFDKNHTKRDFQPASYKKVGKSRKKAVSLHLIEFDELTSQIYGDNEIKRQFWEERNTKLTEILNTSDFIVKPFIQIKQYDWCLAVDLCLPIEVLDAHSANEMAQITKRLLRRETTLAELYPDYTYSKTDWQRENPFQAA